MKRILSIIMTTVLLSGLLLCLGSCNNAEADGDTGVILIDGRVIGNYFLKVDFTQAEYDLDDVSVVVSLGHKCEKFYGYETGSIFIVAGRYEQFRNIYPLAYSGWFHSPCSSAHGEYDNLVFLDEIDYYTDAFYCKTTLNEGFVNSDGYQKSIDDFDSREAYWEAHREWYRAAIAPILKASYSFPFSHGYTLPAELFTEDEGVVLLCYGYYSFTSHVISTHEIYPNSYYYGEEEDTITTPDDYAKVQIAYKLNDDRTKVTLSYADPDYPYLPSK